MAIDKTELAAHLDKIGVGKRTRKKILDGLDPGSAETSTRRTSSGHGAAAPDLTEVPSM